ncbi:(4Fe-4S)-binding protein [Algoriphagus sp.]|uniref:(4Fe-4S)-binding protein n=1 Tax=Algoriphagus sp. TaxID=1872435 RepID=UPI002630A3CE|nr:(4Fe-4S)-binding protein [Algoriphagus sp.]
MEEKKIKKEYSNGEVVVTWEPHKCIHSENCFKGLPTVFNPNQKPWIKVEAETTDRIVEQIKQCPSGALGFYYEGQEESGENELDSELLVEVIPSGPLMVYGKLQVKLTDGSTKPQFKVTAFCRCGKSENKPFCDGTHKKIGFTG